MSNSPEVLRCEAAGEKGEEGAGRASQLRRGGKKDLRVIGCDSPPAELIRCLAAHYGLSDSNSNSDEPEKDSNILVFSKFFFFFPSGDDGFYFFFFSLFYLIPKFKCFYSLHVNLYYTHYYKLYLISYIANLTTV